MLYSVEAVHGKIHSEDGRTWEVVECGGPCMGGCT